MNAKKPPAGGGPSPCSGDKDITPGALAVKDPPWCCDVEYELRRVGKGLVLECRHDGWCRWYQRRKARLS